MVLLSACGTVADREPVPAIGSDFSSIPDAVPRVEPRSPHGNPRSCVVNGRLGPLPSVEDAVQLSQVLGVLGIESPRIVVE